jgi:hypothetical protein
VAAIYGIGFLITVVIASFNICGINYGNLPAAGRPASRNLKSGVPPKSHSSQFQKQQLLHDQESEVAHIEKVYPDPVALKNRGDHRCRYEDEQTIVFCECLYQCITLVWR